MINQSFMLTAAFKYQLKIRDILKFKLNNENRLNAFINYGTVLREPPLYIFVCRRHLIYNTKVHVKSKTRKMKNSEVKKGSELQQYCTNS